jgi:glutamate racemase
MAIGVFDSGVGGLSVCRALVDRLPQADFLYLADQAHAPYGPRPGDEVVDLTRASVTRLFEAGADLVVLACNTASAIALRRLQQSWLPGYAATLGRPVNVLGIIVPTIEAATGMGWLQAADPGAEARPDVLAVFATAGTVRSEVYEVEIAKRRPDIAVFSQACPDLAPMIEGGASVPELALAVQGYVAEVTARIGRSPDRAILGCTHYEIIAGLFRAALPPGTPLIHQPAATADALEAYFARHPEYDLGTGGRRTFWTTGRPGPQNAMVQTFWGGPLSFEAAP